MGGIQGGNHTKPLDNIEDWWAYIVSNEVPMFLVKACTKTIRPWYFREPIWFYLSNLLHCVSSHELDIHGCCDCRFDGSWDGFKYFKGRRGGTEDRLKIILESQGDRWFFYDCLIIFQGDFADKILFSPLISACMKIACIMITFLKPMPFRPLHPLKIFLVNELVKFGLTLLEFPYLVTLWAS